MISLHECSDLSSIADLKASYRKGLVAPMDGMWDTGFTDPAPHWEIRVGDDQAGYYAANDEGALLQFYVRPALAKQTQAIFDEVIAQDSLTHAMVSTIDPAFLSLCLDVNDSVTVHTYMYEVHTETPASHPAAAGLDFRLTQTAELDRVVAFQESCVDSKQDLTGWLQEYSANLIQRRELHVLCREDDWLALGECRRSDTQDGVADLGMMVGPANRREGWATYVLALLRAQCATQHLRAICSTRVENVGAQKAIVRAGFMSRHRIMKVVL